MIDRERKTYNETVIDPAALEQYAIRLNWPARMSGRKWLSQYMGP